MFFMTCDQEAEMCEREKWCSSFRGWNCHCAPIVQCLPYVRTWLRVYKDPVFSWCSSDLNGYDIGASLFHYLGVGSPWCWANVLIILCTLQWDTESRQSVRGSYSSESCGGCWLYGILTVWKWHSCGEMIDHSEWSCGETNLIVHLLLLLWHFCAIAKAHDTWLFHCTVPI